LDAESIVKPNLENMLKGCCQFAFTPFKHKNSPQTGFYKANPEVPISDNGTSNTKKSYRMTSNPYLMFPKYFSYF